MLEIVPQSSGRERTAGDRTPPLDRGQIAAIHWHGRLALTTRTQGAANCETCSEGINRLTGSLRISSPASLSATPASNLCNTEETGACFVYRYTLLESLRFLPRGPSIAISREGGPCRQRKQQRCFRKPGPITTLG